MSNRDAMSVSSAVRAYLGLKLPVCTMPRSTNCSMCRHYQASFNLSWLDILAAKPSAARASLYKYTHPSLAGTSEHFLVRQLASFMPEEYEALISYL